MPNIVEIKSLFDIADKYDGFIIDLEGVIYNSDKLLPDSLLTLNGLNDAGKKIVFLANSSRRVKDMAMKLHKMGIPRELYLGLLTSGEIIYHDLKSKQDAFFRKLGRRYYYIGMPRNRLVFESAGYDCVSDLEDADFIIVGDIIDKDDVINNYISMFQEALSRGMPMICADPDRIEIASNNIPMMGPGYVAEKYSKMGGHVFFRGKPKPETYLYCIEGMQIKDKTKVAVIGDGFENDIMGGYYAGLDTIFISGGVHARELRILPDEVSDIKRVEELSRHFGVFPTYTLSFFK